MEIFNVKRRDIYTFDDYMDLKKPGFGGPASAKNLVDNKGKIINKDRKLANFQNRVERHDAFNHPVWDSTYKAMGGDLVHKQEVGKNPYDYPDPYTNMGIPTVDVGKASTNKPKSVVKKTNEGMCQVDFYEFVFESCDDECNEEECEEESTNEKEESTNEKFSKKYDNHPKIKKGQRKLPDALQKEIVNK